MRASPHGREIAHLPAGTLLTIGHSTLEGADFIASLRAQDVKLLADVRRHPASRRVPWTNAAALEPLLAESGIGYQHLEGLGGRRAPLAGSPNSGWRNPQFRGYADHMASPEFADALERLLLLAAERRTAVMCAEAQWWRCHRRLLSDALVARGVEVLHLSARGDVERHELTPFAIVERGRLTYPPAQATLEL